MRLTSKGARIDVPMDHNNPSQDKTFSIPIIRMLATNTLATNGTTILLNPGGPGGIIGSMRYIILTDEFQGAGSTFFGEVQRI